MLIVYVLATIIALVGPLVAVILLLRRFKVEWQVVIYGILAYVVSDVVLRLVYTGLDSVMIGTLAGMQDVILAFLLVALIYGLASALLSTLAKWLVFRFFRKNTDSWERATIIGTGFGGAEVIMAIGIYLAFALITFLTYNGQDLTAMGLTPEQLTEAQAFLAAFSGQEISTVFTYIIQSVLQMGVHVLASILVWYGFTQRKYWWIVLAFVWHFLISAGQVFLNQMVAATDANAPLWLVWLFSAAFTYWMIWKSRKTLYVKEAE